MTIQFVFAILKFLKCFLEAKCRAPAYSLALRCVRAVGQRGQS